MSILFSILIAALLAAPASFGSRNVPKRFLDFGNIQLHFQTYEPKSHAIGDVLFLHGYGDTFKNHTKLFQELNLNGLRVIAFDYPSHGLTTGDDLNDQSFADLTKLAAQLVYQKRKDPYRPFSIVGWSTGGLHAIRIAQTPQFQILFPKIDALLLLAPGVSVKKCVGNSLCQITNKTLSQNPLLQERQIKPLTPLTRPAFAAKLLLNAHHSWKSALSKNIPALVFVGSDKDQYVHTKHIKKWIHSQRAMAANIQAIQCPQAFHELDNEPQEVGGNLVRALSVQFLKSRALKKTFKPTSLSQICHQI